MPHGVGEDQTGTGTFRSGESIQVGACASYRGGREAWGSVSAMGRGMTYLQFADCPVEELHSECAEHLSEDLIDSYPLWIKHSLIVCLGHLVSALS